MSSLFSKKGTENAMPLPALYEFSVNPRLVGKKVEYSYCEVIGNQQEQKESKMRETDW